MADLDSCKRIVRNGDGHVAFARINEDSTWTFEVVEVLIVGRTMHKTKHMVRANAAEALFFLTDMIDSAKTEANHGGKL